MTNATQKEFVANRLRADGRISRNFCLKNYISRLGALINLLKKDGWEFDAFYVNVETPFGKGRDYVYTAKKIPAEF